MNMQAGTSGRIGSNAILQLLPVLNDALGASQTQTLLQEARIVKVPDGSAMIAQEDAARLHSIVRHRAPGEASAILREAGKRTANYILSYRIPKPAQFILKMLPAAIAARFLSRAIAQHAWTFVGSGEFRVLTPWQFEIARNPLIAGEHAETCLCVWHAAVFERLYRVLVSPRIRCEETDCGAQTDGGICRFLLTFG